MGVGQLIRNVGEALKLTNARTISTTGDATYSVSFDGSSNVSSAITLANTGVAAGTYNALSTQVRPFTIDAKGRITAVGTPVNITPPWSAITGTPTTLSGYGITNALPLSGGTVTGDLVSTSATASTSTTTGVIRAASLGITGAIFANTVSANSYNLIPIGRGAGGIVSNLSIGINALRINSSGGANGAIGNNSLYSNTTGSSCYAFGDSALFSSTTGANNVAIGHNALSANTTASNNSAIGHAALIGKVAGDHCSAFGANAGRFIADGVTDLTASSNSCFIGALTKGTQNATNENVFGFNTTGNGSNTVTIGDNNIVRTYLKGVVDVANTTPSTSTTTGASVIAGGQGIGGNQHIGGFTSLGGVPSGHPAIKMKVLEGVTAATESGVSNIAHGLTLSKIISVTTLVNHSTNAYVSPGYLTQFTGLHFSVSLSVTDVQIINHPTDSEHILSRPVIVTIFYKE